MNPLICLDHGTARYGEAIGNCEVAQTLAPRVRRGAGSHFQVGAFIQRTGSIIS